MAIGTLPSAPVGTRTSAAVRRTAALFLGGGILTAAGGGLHPRGAGDTVDAYLLSMFASPDWPISHQLLIVGAAMTMLAMVSAWRSQAFGPSVQRWLPVAAAAWALAAVEGVPHLLAAHEASALAHEHSTPLLDVHLLLQVLAGPAVGVSTAVLGVAIARAAGSWPSRVLAVLGAGCGVLYGAAGPTVALVGDPRFAPLFAFQAGVALWLLGTGVRLLRPPRR